MKRVCRIHYEPVTVSGAGCPECAQPAAAPKPRRDDIARRCTYCHDNHFGPWDTHHCKARTT